MSRSVPIPYFPVPPAQYSQNYLAEVTRAFSVYAQQINTPGPWRATSLTLTDLQTDDVSLEPNAVFQQGGFLKIVLVNAPHVRGSFGTGQVGLVTVVTT
jgi:hypothetical protein